MTGLIYDWCGGVSHHDVHTSERIKIAPGHPNDVSAEEIDVQPWEALHHVMLPNEINAD